MANIDVTGSARARQVERAKQIAKQEAEAKALANKEAGMAPMGGAPTSTGGTTAPPPPPAEAASPEDVKNAQTRQAAQTALRQMLGNAATPDDPNVRTAQKRQLAAQAGQQRLNTQGQYSRGGMGGSGAAGYGQGTTNIAVTQGQQKGLQQFDLQRQAEQTRLASQAAGLTPVVGRMGMEQAAYERAMKELRQQTIDLAGTVGDTVEFTQPGGGKAYATVVSELPQEVEPRGDTTMDGKRYRIYETSDGNYVAYPI